MQPSPHYHAVLEELTERLPVRARGLQLVLLDGIPASGKSSLARALAERLRLAGRDAQVVENDWFIDRSIRNPVAIARGLALGVAAQSIDGLEAELLRRFLDWGRLGRFQDELERAAKLLSEGHPATLRPEGAHWNLARAPAWEPRSLALRPGGVLIVEGTLSRACYLGRFPEALSVFVEAPVPIARLRFLRRNAAPDTRRNEAFSLIARFGPAYSIAATMLGRDRHPWQLRVDLSDPAVPRLTARDDPPRTRSA